MIKKIRYALISLLILFSQSLSAEYFKHIGISDGLQQFSVMTIYQDVLGRMWFGTKEGISIYNGHEILSYKAYANHHLDTSKRVLIGNDIYLIQGNKEGNVFIIADQKLLKYEIRKEIFQEIISKETFALTSYEGDVWCVVRDSVFSYNEESNQLEFVMKTGLKKINCLTVTQDVFYIGSQEGLFTIDRLTKTKKKIISGVDVYRIFEDSQKEIWIGCRMEGLYRISRLGAVSKVPYTPESSSGISNLQIREFVEDNQLNVWFGTFYGLQKFDRKTNRYSVIKLRKSMGGLEHPSIFSLYKDLQGTIWIGSYYGGVNYFNPESDIFSRYEYVQYANPGLYFSYIGDMTQDNEHNLWICTDGGGISCMDYQTHTFKNFTASSAKDKSGLPHNNVKSICYDSKHDCLCIGTHLGGLSRYDIRKNQFYNYSQHSKKESEGPNQFILDVKFRHDRLYVSARNGVFSMDPQTNEFQSLYPYVCKYLAVDDNHLWLGHGKNMVAVNLKNREEKKFINLEEVGNNFEITRLMADENGIYIATQGSGIFYYDKMTGKVTNYTVGKGQLLSNYCYNLGKTTAGNVIITSDKGIVLFSPVSKEFRSIGLSSGFPAPAIVNECGLFVSPNNEIFIGDVRGITSFRENDLKMSDEKLGLYVSSLLINNQKVYPDDQTGILKETLPFTQILHLKHNQNNLTIGFSISNYVDVFQTEGFEYKLEGFDKEWMATQKMDLHYTNLDPGKYTLHIRAKGHSLGTKGEEISQEIIISSPWYNTIWAWGAYLLILTLCIHYYFKNQQTKRDLALSLEKERFEKQQIERMNEAKLFFFTNVSHEFRTPLTLIINHIDLLMQNLSITSTIYSPIMKINKNAQRMLNLVTELLDFRKLEQNQMVLKIEKCNLVEFLREIHLSFYDYALQRNISYPFHCDVQSINLWFDPAQMEKVFFNLLSNAFKYTSDGGRIEISIRVNDDICIQVVDSGIGIESDKIKYIFDHFYQIENEQQITNMSTGTGIGLALTKNIVEKHHGTISVKSEFGKGSTFSVHLLKDKEHFQSDKSILFSEEKEIQPLIFDSMPTPMEIEQISLSVEKTEPQSVNVTPEYTLLIVEDNEDLLHILEQLFAPFYKIVKARNGKQGLEMTAAEKPDLIISDILMPEMTGTEMCIQLKNNIAYCHTPIVLLTALNTIEQNIEGFNRGADDYITKPFNAKVLLARCNNLVRNRLLIQQQFTNKPISEIDLITINPLDKKLLKQAIEIIDKNIDDPEFDIPYLCRELGIGRTLLFSKLKALTGMTPNNFVLNHKLKKAAIMLRTNPELQISQIADNLGFGSPIYFSRCFKSQFNVSPLVYRKEEIT